MKDENTVITTQLTSKRLKFNLVAGKIIFFAGIIMIIMYAGETGEGRDRHAVGWGALMALYGFAHYATTRLRIWWNHK